MFQLNPNPTFPFVAQITVPGGEAQPLALIGQHKGRAALQEWIELPKLRAETGAPVMDAEYLGQVLDGWQVSTSDGVAVPYSVEALQVLLDGYPAAAGEIFAAYLRALTESRAKN
jgi:hypothetical protein